MTEVLGVAEAKRRFSELIDRIGRGERFVVARRGRPVIALVPPGEAGETARDEPLGLVAFVGAMADVEGWDEMVEDIYRQRRRTRERDVPELA